MNKEKPKKKKTTNTELYEYLLGLEERLDKKLEKVKKKYEKPEAEFREMINILVLACKKNEKVLHDLLRKYEDVEQTLRNVHVAIRQNEYLQAWYPAQSGYGEMNVVGDHPIQKKRRLENG